MKATPTTSNSNPRNSWTTSRLHQSVSRNDLSCIL